MKCLIRIAGCALVCALLLPRAASAAGAFKRLAVMDFENASGDKTLDWVGVGISETLSTELGRIRDLTLVERKRLNDALKEIKFGRSEAVDQATAQKMGKMLGADSVVVGSFQKSQITLRIQARVVDVETGTVRVPARVDGALKDIFDLQIELAKKLVEEMKGSLAEADKKSLEVAPSKSVDALRAYSDGVYFYRNDLAQDAVTEFDRALALDPNYGEAHFYRGMALAKLKRWDDAIVAFKRTLPRTQAEHRVKWSWDAPVEAQGSARTVFPAFEASLFRGQDIFSRAGMLHGQKRIVYTESLPAKTIFHLVDLERRTAKRAELPVQSTLTIASATDRLTVFMSATLASLFSGKMAIYGIDATGDGGLLWRNDLTELGGFPLFGMADSVLWEYFPPLRRLVALSESAVQPKWQRNDIDLEWGIPPVSSTRTHGSVLLVKSASGRRVHAIRLSDGVDAWTVDGLGDKTYQMVSDHALIIFEPDRRVLAVDLETGKPLVEIPVHQITETRTVALASLVTVRALVQQDTLFFSSDANELLAVDLDRATPAERRVRWKTPLQKKALTISAHASRVYVGTEGGDLVILDAKSGGVQATRRIADKNLGVDHAGDDIVVASSEESVYGLDPATGAKQWDYPSNPRAQRPVYFKGAVILQTSGTQISALDARTGALIWQYTGKLATPGLLTQLLGVSMPSIYMTDDAFFIIEQGGVKEYDLERGATQGITNKEALTELASALLAKGDIPEASRFAGTARDADPNFPPLRLLQARLAQARGDAAAARRELIVYADLAGRQSKSGLEIVAELKRDHGLIWQAELGKGALDGARLVDDKRLLSVGKISGRDAQFALLDTANGKVLWRQNAERVLDVTYDTTSRRAFFVRGQTTDPTAVQLNAVDLDSGERKELARLTGPFTVNAVTIAFANDRIFVATNAADVPARKMSVRITCFNAATGARLWEIPHNFTDVNFQDVLVPLGLFYPKKDFLVYSVGRDVRVIRAADGAVYAEHHENAVVIPRTARTATAAADVTYFTTVAGEMVGYNLATRQIVLRTSLPALDPGWIQGALVFDAGLFGEDGLSVFALDVSPSADPLKRLLWRVKAPEDRGFGWIFGSADAIWAYRDDNVLVQLEGSTGKILNEYPLLWAPVDIRLDGDRLYALTADGQAYAMQLKAPAPSPRN